MTLSFLALLWGAHAHPGAHDPTLPELPTGLTVRLVDPHDLLPAGRSATAAEVTSIFAGLGVRVHWEQKGAPEAASAEVPLRVVLLPSTPSGPGWPLKPDALGVTVGDGRSTAPAVYVFFPRLLHALDISERKDRLPTLLDLRRLTRALGRVVAHEIFHALAPGQPHAETGLMRASLSSEFLVGEDAPVDPRWAHLLRRSIEELASRRVLE